MSPDRIFVALSAFGEHGREPVDLLERSGHPFAVNPTGARATGDLLRRMAADATAVIAGVEAYDADLLAALPRLRCIARCGVGTDNIDHAAAKARGITVLNTPDAPTGAVAELAVAMMLALERDLLRQTALVRAGRWERVDARLLGARTVGIVGLGRIGRRVAELLRPFGSVLLGADPRADTQWAIGAGVALVTLDDLLARADVVTLHAASTSETPLRIGAREIASMREGAVLVNLARGDLVDEAALVAALRAGRLRGAGLDVYPEEPYRGELLALDAVVLTPHSATLTRETRRAMEVEAVRGLLAFLGPARQ
jgi:D-3-phosphoglycerate dehydrogenase